MTYVAFLYLAQLTYVYPGPIVRINPIHVHINDPEFYDEIHGGAKRRRDRCRWSLHADDTGPIGGSMLQAMDHDLHRNRRQAVSQFFSKRNIQELEPLMKSKVDKLASRFTQACEQGVVVNLTYAMGGLTMEIIAAYCFGQDMGSLEKPEYAKGWIDALHDGVQIRPLGRHFPTLINAMIRLPPSLLSFLDPKTAPLFKFTKDLEERIGRILSGTEEKDDKSEHRTVFYEMKYSNLPPSEKTAYRLASEASTFMGAGTETTARTLAVASYYLISNPEMMERLKMELKKIMPTLDTVVSLPALEKLPYLAEYRVLTVARALH